MIGSYREALDYLYHNLPMFQRVGAAAYKKDLHNTIALCERLDNPQAKFKSIHVAGTNGKGSTSHLLASILMEAGYRTGLYTSPHLKEFTERIRLNGHEVKEAFVVDFVNRIQSSIEDIQPSFFEITVAMAFDYFVQAKVDIAVIEVGLGGRLDSTNVITPELSVITSIGWDHKDLLGDTLPKIAFEKAGIIKPGVPVVISHRQQDLQSVFLDKAKEGGSSIRFADDEYQIAWHGSELEIIGPFNSSFRVADFPLLGSYQRLNIPGVFKAVDVLREQGWKITPDAVVSGLRNVVRNTHLKGRWQKLQDQPLVVCDTGHNIDGIREVVRMIRQQQYRKLWMVFGMVRDKEPEVILSELPKDAYYFFCQAKIPRALPAEIVWQHATAAGLKGEVVSDVNEALGSAKAHAQSDDFIFVGGSTFVVAEINEL